MIKEYMKILMFCNDNHEFCTDESCAIMEFAGDTKIDCIHTRYIFWRFQIYLSSWKYILCP